MFFHELNLLTLPRMRLLQFTNLLHKSSFVNLDLREVVVVARIAVGLNDAVVLRKLKVE